MNNQATLTLNDPETGQQIVVTVKDDLQGIELEFEPALSEDTEDLGTKAACLFEIMQNGINSMVKES